jgi:CheY-like chemotaxis protein
MLVIPITLARIALPLWALAFWPPEAVSMDGPRQGHPSHVTGNPLKTSFYLWARMPVVGTPGRSSRLLSRAVSMLPASRILLVEDHVDIAEMTKLMLEHMGHEVIVAPSVAAAITEANLHHFDLLVSDYGLPDGNGCDVLMAISPLGVKKAIAVTAYGSEVQRRCEATGFIRCMGKPVEFDELRQAIIEVLNG